MVLGSATAPWAHLRLLTLAIGLGLFLHLTFAIGLDLFLYLTFFRLRLRLLITHLVHGTLGALPTSQGPHSWI